MNPRIRVHKNVSKWGHTRSWSCFVDNEFVGDGKNRREAVKIGEARIANLEQERRAQIERDHLEFDV